MLADHSFGVLYNCASVFNCQRSCTLELTFGAPESRESAAAGIDETFVISCSAEAANDK